MRKRAPQSGQWSHQSSSSRSAFSPGASFPPSGAGESPSGAGEGSGEAGRGMALRDGNGAGQESS
ncbi:MAG: hypothetical protein BRD38_02110 [Bacteroidetes bacterium QH_9_67_14]|nr:MAG: hypothetical protein BRD38_02110 [Bacteroidetes bacterium QH_9_67_14]